MFLLGADVTSNKQQNLERVKDLKPNTQDLPWTYHLSLPKMLCPNCQNPLPASAVLPLSFGTRSYRCRKCGAIDRMEPKAYLIRSFIVSASYLLALLTLLSGNFWYFVALVFAIRIAWVVVAPRVVPLQVMAKPKSS